jgi:thiamine-monophosphate kinase
MGEGAAARPERPGEFTLIARHFAPLAGPGAFGLLDDAATLTPPAGRDLVITKDMLAAGVHFFPDDPPETVGWKALAVNLSDLAAKGATPLAFVVGLGLPTDWTEDLVAGLARGIGALSSEAAIALIGGDTIRAAGGLTLSITALGTVPTGRMVRRTVAEPGDHLVVTGTIGDGALGLRARQGALAGLTADHAPFLVDRYLRPRPRVRAAAAVLAHARAAMDVSDGLVGDLAKMLAARGLGATVIADDVPYSVAGRAAIKHDSQLQQIALTGGDDYEILAAIPPENAVAFWRDAHAAGVPVTRIGTVDEPGRPLRVLDAAGAPMRFARTSYEHG